MNLHFLALRFLCAAAAMALMTLAAPALARSVEGEVSHVSDGDTLWLRPDDGGAALAVRIQGIDAPEICQDFGVQARDALAAHALHRRAQVNVIAQDMYQRSVGRVNVDGQDLGAWLVGNGYAWSAQYRRRAGPYAAQEEQARSGGRGLWAASAMDPREFRKRHGSCFRQ